MSIVNANGWPPALVTQPRQVSALAPAEPAATYVPQHASAVASASNTQAGNSTSQQSYQDAEDEAFAKLKVALQNPGKLQESESADTPKTAAQEFREYMALSPEEKIRQKMLNELGLTEEAFKALPPEEQYKVEQKITQRMKEETEQESLANLQPQLEAMMASQKILAAMTSEQAGSVSRQAPQWKDPHDIEQAAS
ncbi:hypothetical protein DCO48_09485 [Pseudomonas sp. SDI]|uniref:hypothetical protein n=1 Tax=Pseudomonas sp. SDI TaxID=2170734 RepID=UPI000DE64B57|nr:hypothetical protein [Pseudomonas sp. SDI]PWB33523.1 hypothetical protein DCO48_09485 [Pseudomonas sp. SDI]